MSMESVDGVTSGSIENINSYIIGTIVTAVMACMVIVMIIMVDDLHRCCIGVNVHRFWSVWLDMFVVSDWLVMVAR